MKGGGKKRQTAGRMGREGMKDWIVSGEIRDESFNVKK